MKHDPHMYRIATSTMNEIGSMLSREDVFANICNHLEPLLTTPRETLYKQFEQYALFKSGDVVSVTWLISGQEKVYEFQNVTEDWTVDLKGTTAYYKPILSVNVIVFFSLGLTEFLFFNNSFQLCIGASTPKQFS